MANQDTQTASTKAPTHIAYQIREGSEKGYWTRIGAAWAHKDGKGFSIQLECVPFDSRISLRTASPKKTKAA